MGRGNSKAVVKAPSLGDSKPNLIVSGPPSWGFCEGLVVPPCKKNITQSVKGLSRLQLINDDPSNGHGTTLLEYWTIATWNVRGVNQKMTDIIEEIKKRQIQIQW